MSFSTKVNKHKEDDITNITEENSVDEREVDDNMLLLDTVYKSNTKLNNLRSLHYRSDNSIDSFEVRKQSVTSLNRPKDQHANKRNKTSDDLDYSITFLPKNEENPLYSESGHNLVSVLNDISHIKPTRNVKSISLTKGKGHRPTQSQNNTMISNIRKGHKVNQSSFNITIDDNCEHCRSMKAKVIKLSKDKMDMNLENACIKKELVKKKSELDETTRRLNEKIKESEKDAEFILKQEKEIARLYKVLEKYTSQGVGKKNNKVSGMTEIMEEIEIPIFYKK
jgi:hypothetical protein